MSFQVSREEVKLVVLFGAFGAFWMLMVVPYLIDSVWFQSQNSLYQYVFYNLGLFGLTTGIFGIPLGKIAEGGTDLSRILRAGLSSLLSFSVVLDNIQPPFFLDPSGHVIITNQESLSGPAVDSMLTYVWTQLFPQVANTSTLYQLVYVVSPLLGLIAAALLLRPRQFKNLVASSLNVSF